MNEIQFFRALKTTFIASAVYLLIGVKCLAFSFILTQPDIRVPLIHLEDREAFCLTFFCIGVLLVAWGVIRASFRLCTAPRFSPLTTSAPNT